MRSPRAKLKTAGLPVLLTADADDASVVRETFAGFRGGKQWNIMEDTPGGHAAEKLVIVQGVEFLDDEDELSDRISLDRMRSEDEDEDEDILDDAEDDCAEDESVARSRSKSLQSLPSDPGGISASPRSRKSRFDPTFANSAMWTDDEASVRKTAVKRFPSGDFSMISDHALISTSTGDISEHDEIDVDNHTGSSQLPSSVDRTKASTERRSAGRRPLAEAEAEHNSASDLAEDDEIDEAVDEGILAKYPASVPEDGPLGSKKTSSRKKASSSGRRSNQGSGHSGSKRAIHGQRKKTEALDRFSVSGHRKHSDMIPATPVREVSSYVRSPLSSSLTSTPNSRSNSRTHSRSLTSSIARQQQQGGQQQSPRRRKNKPLRLHVEANRPDSTDDDEHTLGASTITTNFSTTQRTLNTVTTTSTRSLFRTADMPKSEPLQMPRRRADSDNSSEERRQKDDEALTAFDVIAAVGDNAKVENPFGRPLPTKQKAVSTLRRPSRDVGDLLASTKGITSSEEFSEGDSSAAADSNPKASSKSFLQLEPESIGVSIHSTIAASTAFGVDGRAETHGVGLKSSHVDSATKVDDGEDDAMPELTDWRDPATDVAKVSPASKRRFKLNLFKRGKSWKGGVPLDDDEGLL